LGVNEEEMSERNISSAHPGGVNVGLRDGSAQFIPGTIDPKEIAGLLAGTSDDLP
jgi:hypothetical protein